MVCIEHIRSGKDVIVYTEESLSLDESCLLTFKTRLEDIQFLLRLGL